MTIRTCRLLALVLAGLGLAPGAAHVLELGPKMAYDPALYAHVTSTLYRYFGSVGAVVQIAAVVAAAVLAVRERGSPSFGRAALGCLALVGSLGVWAAWVAPVNAQWGDVLARSPAQAPTAYAALRDRWEYGHVAAFLAWLVGFGLLAAAVVGRTPADRAAGAAVPPNADPARARRARGRPRRRGRRSLRSPR